MSNLGAINCGQKADHANSPGRVTDSSDPGRNTGWGVRGQKEARTIGDLSEWKFAG